MKPIKPCLEAEIFMENLRRSAKDMSREELIDVIDHLSRLYCKTKTAANWLAGEAAEGWRRNA
jgi:hypothetical protein